MPSKHLMRLATASTNELAATVADSQFCKIEHFTNSSVLMLNALLSADIFKGYPSGRIIQLAGDPGCGKTRLATLAALEFQRRSPNGIIIWIDTEAAVDASFFERDGFDTDRILYMGVDCVEQLSTQLLLTVDEQEKAMKDFEKALKKGTVTEEDRPPELFIVIDSIGNVASRKELEDTRAAGEKRDMTRQQKLKSLFRVITGPVARTQTTMIVINHVYAGMGGMFAPAKVIAGGSGIAYISSITIMLSKKKAKEGEVQVGAIIRGLNVKNRLAQEGKKVETYLSFKLGFHPYFGMLEYAINCGAIVKDGTKYNVPHLFREHPYEKHDLFQKHLAKIHGKDLCADEACDDDGEQLTTFYNDAGQKVGYWSVLPDDAGQSGKLITYDVKLWEKELYTEVVFTKEVLDRINMQIHEEFSYGNASKPGSDIEDDTENFDPEEERLLLEKEAEQEAQAQQQ